MQSYDNFMKHANMKGKSESVGKKKSLLIFNTLHRFKKKNPKKTRQKAYNISKKCVPLQRFNKQLIVL